MFEKLMELYDTIVNMIKTSCEALVTFKEGLEDFDKRIVSMVDNCGSTEFDGLPVNKAIATYHYVVGDLIFYLIYIMVLFGCLFTILHLVNLIISKLKGATGNIGSGIFSRGGISSIFSKFLIK